MGGWVMEQRSCHKGVLFYPEMPRENNSVRNILPPHTAITVPLASHGLDALGVRSVCLARLRGGPHTSGSSVPGVGVRSSLPGRCLEGLSV